MEPGATPNLFRFGPFEANTSAAELRKHGIRIQLPRQPFQILMALLDRPGEVLTREELQQQLWPENTFVDFEKGLNTAVNKLRHALGDSPDKPLYIETLAGKGYRFIAPVHRPGIQTTEAALEPAAPAVRAPESSVSTRYTTVTWTYLLAGVIIIASLFGAYFTWFRPAISGAPSAALRFTIDAPSGTTFEPAGSRQGFAVSPDGRRVALIALADNSLFGVWVRDLASLEPRRLSETDGVHSLFWSADSRSLFFSIASSLRRSALEGGSYQLVAEIPSAAYQVATLPENRLLLASRGKNYTVAVSGGAVSALPIRYSWPQTLPGGERLLSIAFDERLQRNRVRISSIGKDSFTDLLESDSRVQYAPSPGDPDEGHLLYIRAGNLLAQRVDLRALQLKGEAHALVANIFYFLPTGAADFSVSENGMLVYLPFTPRSHLAWLDRQGNEVGSVGQPNIAVKYARLSPDGRKIAAPIYNIAKGVTEIWIFDSATGAGRRIASGASVADAPVWSPDSSSIVYGRATGGAPKLYSRGMGDNDPEKALPPDTFQLPSDWSSDGRFIGYSSTVAPGRIASETEGNVSLLDLKQGKTLPLLKSRAYETGVVFAPAGGWIAFLANDSSRQELYVQQFATDGAPRALGERRLVSKNGALAVRWSRDGKELFYLGMDSRLYSVPLRLEREPIFGEAKALFSIPLDARASLPTSFGFDVSLDGRRFLVPVVSPSRASLVAIQNWQSLLR